MAGGFSPAQQEGGLIVELDHAVAVGRASSPEIALAQVDVPDQPREGGDETGGLDPQTASTPVLASTASVLGATPARSPPRSTAPE